jgi:hypothetical protein
MAINIYQMAINIYQMAGKYSKWPKIYQHFPFQGPPKYTQIGILGMKIYHLATLFQMMPKLESV